jgi:hypothetical protein
LLAAEEVGESDLAALALETIVLGHFAARRQRAPQLSDTLDVAAELDLLRQELRPRRAVGVALVRETHGAAAREFGCGGEVLGHGLSSFQSCEQPEPAA